jgi:membrane-associated phospholipid phosphatase
MRTPIHPARGLRHLDAAIEKAVAPYRRNKAVQALGLYGKLGDQPPLRALCAAVILAGVVRRDPRLARSGIRMLAAHELATGVKSFLKHRIDRKRPRDAEGPADNAARPGKSRARARSSFPSGHSAGTVAVARAFGREFPEHRPAALGAAALAGAVQVPRSAHFATDVVAGVVTGWVAEAAVNGAFLVTGRLLARLPDGATRAPASPPPDPQESGKGGLADARSATAAR